MQSSIEYSQYFDEFPYWLLLVAASFSLAWSDGPIHVPLFSLTMRTQLKLLGGTNYVFPTMMTRDSLNTAWNLLSEAFAFSNDDSKHARMKINEEPFSL